MLSGTNVFEISDIQEGETAAVVTKRVECNNALYFTEKWSPIEFLRACLSKTSKYLSGRRYTPFLVLADAHFHSRARPGPG